MTIEKILRDKGPLLSGELADIIGKIEGGSKDAIRKRISRTKLPVTRIKGFFVDNQSFFYLQEQYNKEIYFDALREACKKSAKRFYAVIKAIEYHQGYIKANHLPAYTFSPVQNLKGHKKIKQILENLSTLKIILFEDGSYTLNSLIENNLPNYKEAKGIETAKNFLLTQFSNWAKTIGLSSYNTGSFYSEFGKFQWGFTSPSYINSLTAIKNEKLIPAFLLADVLIGKEASEEDISFFIEKIKILNAQKNISKFIPFLIVDSLTPEALSTLKKNGVVIGFVNKLFGYEYGDLLKALITTITNAGAILKKNPEAYLELITKINKLVDGKTNNLRGDLFELAVGFYHSRLCNNLDIGKQISYEGVWKEIDILATYPDYIKIAECKGYKNKVTKEEVEKWLTEKIPIIRNWIINQPMNDNKKLVFELWSTGGFDDDALVKIKKASETTRKYKIEYYDQAAIIEKAKEVKSPKFNTILKQYYFGEEL
jgi:hypothetical protein